jgi:hypothetical protein
MYYVVCFSLIERRVFFFRQFLWCSDKFFWNLFFGGLSFFSALLTKFGVFFLKNLKTLVSTSQNLKHISLLI